MKKDQEILTQTAQKKAIDAISLLEASLNDILPFDPQRYYTPKEREPYDALSDRFVRSTEVCISFFKSYEKLMYGENSETVRDLLLRMEKMDLIDTVKLWMEMRDIRNRIVHDYLPDEIKKLYDLIMGQFGKELLQLEGKMLALNLQNKAAAENLNVG